MLSMAGFYTLRRLIEEIKRRESSKGPLNLSVARNVDPKFKYEVIERLGIEEREFIGLIVAMNALGLVKRGRLIEISSPGELYDIISQSRLIEEAIVNISRMRRIFIDSELGAISFSGDIAKDLGKRLFPSVRSIHAVEVLIEILKAFLPFVIVPGRSFRESTRDVNQLILCLEELGGVATVEELYKRCVDSKRLCDLYLFIKALSKAILLHGKILIASEESLISKQARIALARFLRAEKEYEEISADRVKAFTDRILDSDTIASTAKNAGFNVEEDRIFKSELIALIDESIPKNSNDFLSAYGKVRIKLSNYDKLLIKFSTRRR